MANRFNIETVFKAVDRFSGPVAVMQTRTTRLLSSMSSGLGKAQKALQGVSKFNSRVADGLKKTAAVTTVAGIAIGASLKSIISTGADVEQTLISAGTKFIEPVHKGTEAFEQLAAVAKDVGGDTEFSTTQAAQGLEFLALAGFDAQQSMASLPGLVDLATSAQAELGTASDIATDSLGAFNLMTKDSIQLQKNLARVSDVLVATSNSTNTSIEQLFEAVREGGPVFTSASASMETFAAMAGTLANAGIKGAASGNVLKNVVTRLAAPASAGAKALKELGITTQDAAGNLRDPIELIGELKTALADMGTAEQASKLDAIFGKRAIAGANVLLAAGSDELNKLRKQYEAAGGTAKRTAASMRDSTSGWLKSLSSAIESVKLEIFDALHADIDSIVKSMTEWVRENRQFAADKVKQFVQFIRDSIPAIKNFGAGLKTAFQDAAPLFMGAFNVVKKLFGLFSNEGKTAEESAFSMGRTVANLAMAFVGLNVATKVAMGATGALQGIVGGVKMFHSATTLLTGGAFKAVKAIMAMNAAALLNPYVLIGAAIVAAIALVIKFWPQIKAFFINLWEHVKDIASSVGEFFAGLWQSTVEVFMSIWTPIKNFLVGVFDFWLGAAALAFRGLLVIWEPIGAFFSAVWAVVSDAVAAVWDGIKAAASTAFAFVAAVWQPIGGFFASLWSGIAQAFAAAWNGITEFAGAVFEVLKEIWSPIGAFFSVLWQGIVDSFNAIMGPILDVAGSIIDKVSGFVGSVRDTGTRVRTGQESFGGASTGPQVVSPQERISRSISETNTTNTTRGEVTIRDQTGRAQITKKPKGSPVGLQLTPSGAF